MPKAPRRCPAAGCTNHITHTRYCPTHTQAWAGPRTTSSRITATRSWRTLRDTILDRDHYQCRIQYPGICTHTATTVDKIIPAAQRPDLARVESNLRAACHPCNQHKARTTDHH